MSVLTVCDDYSVTAELHRLAGQRIVKRAGDAYPVYNLAGTLYLGKKGWVLLSVPNALVRGVFQAMDEPGIELPPGPDGKLEAHISVMSDTDIESIGGAEKITERGKQFHYSIGRLLSVQPDGWEGVNRVWFLTVHSPDLQALRRSYGLSSLPHDGEYVFHLTCAIRRKGVLGRNDNHKK